jgi:hypothetical protein
MATRQTTLLLKRSNVIEKIPPLSGLTLGEMALNTADAKLYTLFTSGTTGATEVRQIGWDRVSKTGDTISGNLIINGSISATTYQNLPVSGLTPGNSIAISGNNGNFTISFTGATGGDYLPLSGGTVSGNTIFTSGLTATTLSFNTSYSGTTPYGTMSWNTDFGVPQVGMIGGNVIQKVGESVYAYVKNVDTTPLTKGEVVYIFGASGDKLSVKRASSTGDTTSSKTLGVVAETIAVNGLGYVITQGTLDGLDLGTYTAGDIVWLSRTPGQFTKTKEYAPNHLVFVGVIQRANNGNGQLYVKPQNGYELEELHNVAITGATMGDLLIYSANSGDNLWVNSKTLPGSYTITGDTSIGGNLTVSGNTSLQGLTATTTNINGNLTVTGNTSLQSFTGTSGIINGNLTVTGNTSLQSFTGTSGIINGNLTVTGNTSLQGLTATTTNINGNLTVTGNTRTQTLRVTSGSTAGYVLTAIDTSGNTEWRALGSTTSSELDPVISITGTSATTVNIGDRYLISGGTGSWSTRNNQIAEYTGTSSPNWSYTTAVTDNIVFVTNTLTTYRFDGNNWIPWQGTSILQNGNSLGTAINIGTNDNQNLTFKTSGQTRMLISGSTGRVYIGTGTTMPIDETLVIDGGGSTNPGGSNGGGSIKFADSRYFGYRNGNPISGITGTTLTIAQTAASTFRINHDFRSNENITFGPSNRIFITAPEIVANGDFFINQHPSNTSNPSRLIGRNLNGFNIDNSLGIQNNTTINGIILQGRTSWNGGTGTTATSTINSVKISPEANMIVGTTNGNLLVLDPTINYTGGSLSLRGIYYNPIISATTSAFTETAIETVRGNVLFNTLTGNTGIGTSNPTRKLDVAGDYKFVHNPVTGLTSSVSGYGDIVTFGSGSLTAGNLYYLNSSSVWTIADADSVSGSTGLLAIALGTTASAGMLIRGYVRSATYTEATGAILYVSTTDGAITATAPIGAGDVVRIVGYQIDSGNNVIYFNPSNDWRTI